MTSDALAAWVRERGASDGAASLFARHLVGQFAGRDRPRPRLRMAGVLAADIAIDLPRLDPTPAADGTVRFVVHLADGALVETVLIPHPQRTTVCLSSQAGCARGCVFCETGRLGLTRNLATEEITGQFAGVARWLAERGACPPTNVVFMGMGEPLDNLDAVLAACDVLCDPCGFALAARRITVSTVGVVPRMRAFYHRAGVRLAVSLHAANDAERQALVPAARTWDLASLRAAIAESPRTVLLQWTLISAVNDRERDVTELIAFCRGLDVRVNLIPLNPGPEERLRAPPMERIRAFQKQLRDAGVRVLVRMPHGQEVGGACGQLAGALRDRPELKPGLAVMGRARPARDRMRPDR
jgi:23S rRNA (adenine2503-C2)-methyltransferase